MKFRKYRINDRYNVKIDNEGNVYHMNGEPVTIWYNYKTSNGHPYPCCTLFDKLTQKKERVMIHRIVAYCWCSGYEKGKVVDHINNDPNDHRPENLRWVSQSENMQHYFREQKKAAR